MFTLGDQKVRNSFGRNKATAFYAEPVRRESFLGGGQNLQTKTKTQILHCFLLYTSPPPVLDMPKKGGRHGVCAMHPPCHHGTYSILGTGTGR